MQKGDLGSAREEIRAGLSVAPQDKGLQELAQLAERKVRTSWDAGALRAKLQSLLGISPAQEEGKVLAASPIRWGLPDAGRLPPGVAAAGPARPPSSGPRVELGREGALRLRLDDPAEAERYLTAKLRESPSDWLAYRLRALARRRLKNYAGARADAGRALELNPQDAWSYGVRSLISVDESRYQDALDDAGRALRLDPGRAPLWRTRALAWEGLGKQDEMLADLKKAAELDPQFAALYREALAAGGAGSTSSAPQGRPLADPWRAAAALAGLVTALFLLARRRTGAPEDLTAPASPGAPASLIPRQLIGHCEVLRRVGVGGMGEVYEAMDLALERRVALKRMRAEISADPRERRRFLKEARTVAALRHPNIVEIYSVLEQPEELYLIFEYVPGEPLSAALQRESRLEPARALGLLRQVAAGLDYAHGRGVIHRDLKPSNIMLGGQVAKVMDFGIARSLRHTVSTRSLAEIVGTPSYMAPEQARGECVKESDLYALGVCLYEMLSGALPTRAGGFPTALEPAIPPPPLNRAAPGIPCAVDAVAARALHPDPARRYHSGAELVAALEAALRDA